MGKSIPGIVSILRILKIGGRHRVRSRILRWVTRNWWRRRIALLVWRIPRVLSWLFRRVLGRGGVTGVPGLLGVFLLGPTRIWLRVAGRRRRHGHHGLGRPRVVAGPVVDVAGWDGGGGGTVIPHHRGTYRVRKGHPRVLWTESGQCFESLWW